MQQRGRKIRRTKMLQETNLDKALKMVLAGKPVLAAVKKAGDTGSGKYTFR